MKLKLLILSTVLGIVLGLSGFLRADSTVTQVTNNSYQDSFPQIKSNYVVWQGHVGTDWEIFLYNIATGVTTQITHNNYDDLSPQTDGNYIVWQGFEGGEWDIFLWDGGEILSISNRGAEDYSPQIANGLIVWPSEPFGDDFLGPGEVLLYAVETQTLTPLSQMVDFDNTLDDTSPRINNKEVAWLQTDEADSMTFIYDLKTRTITPAPEEYVWKDNPQSDGTLRISTRYDSHDWEIFLYNSDSRRYHQITDNSLQDRYPTISGNYVAWMADGEIFLAECKYLAVISPTDNAVLPKEPPPVFTWEGIGYDKFKVQFSEDPDFLTGNTLTLPLGEESYLSDTSITPTEEEWRAIRTIEEKNGRAYWRVEAKGSDESVSYSETWSFTIDEGGVTATDTTTRSGGGDSGLCFIGTAAFGK